MKNKKILLLLISSCLVMGSLTGCSLFEKDPTAEELVDGIDSLTDAEYANMSVEMTIDMSADMGEEMGGASMNMGIDMNADVEYDKDTMFMDGTVGINIFGMDVEQELKSYTQKDGDEKTTYSYDAETDTWTYSIEENEKKVDKKDEEQKVSSLFDELVLAEIEKDDTEYTVTGVVDFSKISEVANIDSEEMAGDMLSGEDTNDIKMNTTMTFDRETKTLKTVKMDIVPESIKDIEDVEIKELSIIVTINEIGGDKEVSVPTSVIKDSVLEETTGGFEFNMDDDSDTEVIEETPVATEEPEQKTETEVNSETSSSNVTVSSTGKYTIESFIEFAKANYGNDVDIYEYVSESLGYVVEEFDIRSDDYIWYISTEFTVYATEADAQEAWEWSFADDYMIEYLEEYEANGAEVTGYSTKNTSYAKINGADFRTNYAYLDGNTIIEIDGRVDDWDRTPTAEEDSSMMTAFDELLGKLGYSR